MQEGDPLAAHHRQVESERARKVPELVEEVAARHDELRASGGRSVAELRPALDWDKGRAIRWLLDQLQVREPILPISVGDDLTDEDALAEIADDGLGVVVRSDEHGDRPTAAHLAVDDPAAVAALLRRIGSALETQT